MYSLVNAPVLGFDLARRERGDEVAGVLLAGLALTRGDVPALPPRLRSGAAHRREAILAAVGTEPSLRTVSNAGGRTVRNLLDELEAAPVGTSGALLRMVRGDVLAWAADVRPDVVVACCDAVLASYLGEQLPPREAAALARPWEAVGELLRGRRPDLGPAAQAVECVLDQVAAMCPADLEAVSGAHLERGPDSDWAVAMHEATWAAYLSGRLRAAAAAQFRLVVEVHRARLPVAALAAGGWSALSGLVQLGIVEDVLPAGAAERLAAPRRLL